MDLKSYLRKRKLMVHVLSRSKLIVVVCLFLFADLNARQEGNKDEEKIEQIKVGTFALKASQQPGPLISFGQNMVDRGDLQLFSFIDDLAGCNTELIAVIPTLLYGFRDDFSLYVQLPVLAKFKQCNMVVHSLQDLLVQFEWAFIDKTTVDTTTQMTAVVNVTLPTGGSTPSNSLSPRAHGSFGSPTFFIGFTAEHFTTTWYPFVSAGAKLTTKNQNSKLGNQFLYQCGLGRNICAKADAYILNWMVEFDGTYRQQNKTVGKIDPNSGGNQIFLGPSLWLSTPHFSLQAGISGVVYQHLFGKQNTSSYLVSVDVGYKF